MPNIPYRDELDTEAEALAERIRARRGGVLLNLDRMLLHHPYLTAGWTELFLRIRAGQHISDRHRELGILAVGSLTGARYELHHHKAPFLAGGGTEEQYAAVVDSVPAAIANADLFDAAERAILTLALESTRDVALSPETVGAVRSHFPEPAQFLELLMSIASYNFAARILVGLGIEIEAETP
ncbi:carboxymuconolactone decarboxylase family protein [Phenylobacterium conjunctum]|uniref:Carboxymuconolactone decarboxylase family protein n=1 Tax=Phenylobacterium conjunctum TaxID=1298959 RepID=A0ABW3T1K7_9CAUL